MWQALHDAWRRLATQTHPRSFADVLAARALETGSFAYQAAVRLRNAAYDRAWIRPVALPCRVVSVGNLTVGGAGKTACVELVAKKLLARGCRVAVLSRGYGGRRRPYWLRWEDDRLAARGIEGAAPTDGLADEPQLLARRLAGVPIVVGPRRAHTGRFACRTFSPEVVILDDGFQHRRLHRDCDIVLVHARTPCGGWAAFPRGPMREPLAALSRAHVIIITKADEALDTLGALGERLRAFNRDAAFVTAAHEPTGLLNVATGERHHPERLAGMRVGLLSSIGDPEGFEATVGRLHATVLWHRIYPDHHRYRPADWTALGTGGRGIRPDAIVTTEKDWVRLQPASLSGGASPVPVWVLEIKMRVLSGEDVLDARLDRLRAR